MTESRAHFRVWDMATAMLLGEAKAAETSGNKQTAGVFAGLATLAHYVAEGYQKEAERGEHSDL